MPFIVQSIHPPLIHSASSIIYQIFIYSWDFYCASYSISLHYSSIHMPISNYLNYSNSLVNPTQSFLKSVLAILDPLLFPIKILINFSTPRKNLARNLVGIAMILWNNLGKIGHLSITESFSCLFAFLQNVSLCYWQFIWGCKKCQCMPVCQIQDNLVNVFMHT